MNKTQLKILTLIANRIHQRTIEEKDFEGITLTVDELEHENINPKQAVYELKKLDRKNWIVTEATNDDLLDYESVSLTAPYFLKNKVKKLKSGDANEIEIEHLEFDPSKSILEINDETVKISKTSQVTKGHHVLDYIFNCQELDEKADYYDIYQEKSLEGSDGEFDSSVIYRACDDIQEKVEKTTDIDDFLEYTYSQKGWVQVNSDYIPESY